MNANRFVRLALTGAIAVLGAACAYTGPQPDVVRHRAQWFSYLAAHDLRAACEAGGERYRIVYNADFNWQTRAWDVVARPGGGAEVSMTVDRGLRVEDVFAMPRAFPVVHRDGAMDAEAMAALVSTLDGAGVFRPAPGPVVLASDKPYLYAAGCRDGRFFMRGWTWSDGRPGWPELVAALPQFIAPDLAPAPPPEAVVRPPVPSCRPDETVGPCFVLTVVSDRIPGL